MTLNTSFFSFSMELISRVRFSSKARLLAWQPAWHTYIQSCTADCVPNPRQQGEKSASAQMFMTFYSWRSSYCGHVRLAGDPRAYTGPTAGTTYPIWPGWDPQEELEDMAGKKKRLLCFACCNYHKRIRTKKNNGWMSLCMLVKAKTKQLC